MPKFCTSCGASVADVARFCNRCGTRFLPTQPTQSNQTAQFQSGSQPPPTYQAQPPSYQQAPTEYPPMYTAPPTAAGMPPNVAATLSYIMGFVTGIIFLVIDPYNKDRFVRFHAFQSIFLSVAIFAVTVVLNIFRLIMPWWLDFIPALLSNLISLAGVGVWIFAMIKAYHGERFKIPVIGDIAEQQADH